jgi:predicted extracellular nuclease
MKERLMVKRRLTVLVLIAMLLPILGGVEPALADPLAVFINEIHYDNASSDAGEAVEIAGPAATDLTGWSLVLYNGNGGAVYNTIGLVGVIPDQQNGFGTLVFPISGIQNGSPDGVALVDPGNTVIQFLSYEGSFTATGGPANGMTSTDIGVSESSSTPVGDSLQLTGTGTEYEDFSWASPGANTFGAVNSGQTFDAGGGPADPVINEFVFNHTSTDTNEYVEVFGDADTNYSAFTIVEIEGDGSGAGLIDDGTFNMGTTDAGGFWTTGFQADVWENGTVTLLLVEGYTGSVGQDLDTDNDGSLEVTPWDTVVDAVAVTDGDAGDLTYGVPSLVPNYDGVSVFAPGGASRIPDGFDTDAATDWVRNDFDLAGIPGFPGSLGPGEALNTPGATNQIYVPPPEACGDPFTSIYAIQGSGPASPLDGSQVATEGIVVGDFQDGKGGFFLQDAAGDGDMTTSDGIFVFGPSPDVNVGDHVRVRGGVQEFFGLTEIAASQVWLCSTGNSVAPTALSLPVTSVDDFEAYEGMLVTFPQPLYISEFFNFDRFGEIVLTTDRQFQPTATFEPGSPEAASLALANSLSRITLDDGRGSQNPDPAIHPNGNVFDLTNLFRGGDTVQNVTGALDYNFGLYKVQPTQGADYTSANPRTAQPDDVGGNLTVASFNVLNYFTTLDYSSGHPLDNTCGPLQDQGCRGADANQPLEFTRQRDKIIAALTAIDADVVGLIEIENHPGDVPTEDLVGGLNAVVGSGTYDYIATGAIGPDVIRVALIYKPASVTPKGSFAVLDTLGFLDPAGTGTDRNRAALAQTFTENATGGTFTAVVNHFKSKSGSEIDDRPDGICVDADPANDILDCDQGDGQGFFNHTRTLAAAVLTDWLATDPTGSGDADFLIIGDLNSYDKEDPIDVLRAAGYSDLLSDYVGEMAYSYVFDGQLGYLDYAMANQDLLDEVTGATAWHINSDEPDILDYDTSFKQDAQDALYEPNAYRASDHDPVINGLSVCDEIPPTLEVSVTPDTLWPANHKYVEVEATVVAADNFDPNPFVELLLVMSNEPDNGEDDGNTVDDIVIDGEFTFQLRAERSGIGTGRRYTITYQVTDACGNETQQSATVSVPLSQGN